MDFRDTGICQTCLSSDRTLHPLFKLEPLLKELQFLQINITVGGICWECHRIIQKIRNFKKQVLHVQNILFHNSEVKYIGSLTTISKSDFDYKFSSNIDPLKYTSNVPESDTNKYSFSDVKEEVDVNDKLDLEDGSSEGGLSSSSGQITLDNEANDNKFLLNEIIKDEKKLRNGRNVLRPTKKKTLRSRKKEEEELRDKFVTVIFTEEEMIRNREQKRRQPNFKKIPYKCDSCVLGFTRKENYDLHYAKKHDESIGAHSCPVCATRFARACALEAHRRRHYALLRCALCGHETVRRGAALAHCAAKHARDRRGRIHCAHCRFVARTPEELSEHKRTQHAVQCNECGEHFKGMHTLRTHKMRIHAQARQFSCDKCHKTFKSGSRLEAHAAAHCATLARRLAYCAACDVQYKNIYVYRNHLRNSANHSERAYHCKDCNKSFASKVYWRKHCDFYHLKKSRFKCEICNKLLISDWRLKNHMQTRHGSARAREHACNSCPKTFYTLATLRAHRLTHSAQRSYMCEQCGDTFKQRAALHTHARALHPPHPPHPPHSRA